MRIVTLDTLPPLLNTKTRIPIAVRATMNTVQPVTIDKPVTLGAEQLRTIVRNRLAEVVHKRVPIRQMMAIQTPRVQTVLQDDVGVLGQRSRRLGR